MDDWIAHHGVKGQKWYVRRFQNPDGSLTSAGKKRYGTPEHLNNVVSATEASKKATIIGTLLGGPIAGGIAGGVSYKKHLNALESNEIGKAKGYQKHTGRYDWGSGSAETAQQSSSTNQKSNFKQFKREQKSASNAASAMTKDFVKKNAQLIKKLEDTQKDYRKYLDQDNVSYDSYVTYGENSKKYKQEAKKTDTLFKAYANKHDKILNELMTNGKKYVDDKLGSYANKKISGMNVRGASRSARELFLMDLENNAFKLLPDELQKLHK